MPLSDQHKKALLDWVLGGAAVTQPTARWLSFATGSPTQAGASDGPCSPRLTCTWGAANSPSGSSTHVNGGTSTSTALATYVAWNLWDASVNGTRILWGTFTANIGCKSADNPALGGVGGPLKIVLS